MAVTDDDYFWDGINLFRFSSTGQGNAPLGGRQPSFVSRYRTLATNVINTLWRLRSAGQIVFVSIDWWGDSSKPNGPIRVALSTRSPVYLPVVASILAHEASHLNTPSDISPNYVPDELVCRTLECLFYQDLVSTGVRINSRVHNKTMTFKLTQANYIGQLREQYDHFLKDQLIDFVLADKEYRSSLTPDWLDRNLNYWGGPRNRWSPTLGYFVRTLAASPFSARNLTIQKLMMVASDRGSTAWLKMIREATRSSFPASRIKSALSDPFVSSRDTATMKRRIAAWGLASRPHNGLDCLP